MKLSLSNSLQFPVISPFLSVSMPFSTLFSDNTDHTLKIDRKYNILRETNTQLNNKGLQVIRVYVTPGYKKPLTKNTWAVM
jgi:hypothetical protein